MSGPADPRFVDSVFLQLPVERGFADSQHPRGHHLVAVETLERAQNRLLFHLRQRYDLGALGGRAAAFGDCPDIGVSYTRINRVVRFDGALGAILIE